VEKPVIKEVSKPCLKTPPPEMDGVPAPTECVKGMLCLSVADFNTFASNVEKLIDRVNDDWTLCKPPEVTK
jgi:hypothetical protein